MERIGTVAVDAGIVMVGDPCYTLPDDASHRDEVVKDWGLFVQATFDDPNNADGYSSPLGQSIAVVVSSGYGDGLYPVYVERSSDGRVARLIVEFIPEEEEVDECALCSNPANPVSAYCDDCDSLDDDDEEEDE